MRINFYPIRYFNPLAVATAVQAGEAALQGAVGLVQTIAGGGRARRAMKRRRAFQTPDEIFKILQATESIQGGLSPDTLSYISGTADNALSTTLNTAKQLGADPNVLSNFLDQRIQAGFELGAKNQLENMRKFQQLIGAYSLVADNKAAEQKSQQDLIKDELQAASAQQQAGFQNILGGVNTANSAIANSAIGNLYAPPASQGATTVNSSLATPDYYIDVYNQLQNNRSRRVGG